MIANHKEGSLFLKRCGDALGPGSVLLRFADVEQVSIRCAACSKADIP
jgi:hypothetical protein